MRKSLVIAGLLGATLSLWLPSAPAFAQATRTWVSGVGDDANPCSRTAPCKTWAGAISKTANGGEIDALDPGGFGGLTITKSITLDGGGGQVASTLVAGVSGINVVAQPTDVVTIRNVRFDGLLGNGSNSANAGTNGVNFTAGQRLELRNVDIFGFNTTAVNVALGATGTVLIDNCTLTNNGSNAANAYVKVSTTAGSAVVLISNCTFQGSNFAGNGVLAGNGAAVTISNSVFQTFANGAQTTGSGTLFVDTSIFANNINALNAGGGAINVSNNGLYGNSTAFAGAGSYVSDGRNRIGGTGAQGATPTAMNVK
jgi:hypothetical protein